MINNHDSGKDDGQCILIVDDQPLSISLLRNAVASLAEIYFAIDGATALALAKELRPALILLDIDMPGMDGYAVLAGLRTEPALDHCLVVFITSHDRELHELQSLRAGGIDFLQKPLNLPVARARIGNLYRLSVGARALARARHEMEELMWHLPAFVAHWDDQLRNIFCNDRDGTWFGVDAASMAGQPLDGVFAPSVYAVLAPLCHTALQGKAVTVEMELQAPGADMLYGQVALACRREGGVPMGVLMLITDLSARRRAEMALADEQERMRVTLNSIGDAVITTDDAGLVTFCNPIAETMTGWLSEEALGLPIEQVMPLLNGHHGAPTRNPVRLALTEQRIVGMAIDCCLRRRDGRIFDVEDSAAPILDHTGALRGAIIVFHDVSEARAMAIKMTHLANHDALTNLPNRMLLRDRCEQALQKARRTHGRVALLTLDLDHFKGINATAGYGNGDLLLQQVAQRLETALRSGDTLSRHGGDEFLVLLSEIASVDEVNEFCLRLHRLLGEPFQVGAESFELGASIGIALFPDDSSDIEQLYNHADSAMYRAKQEGRARSRFFAQEIDDTMRARVALQRELGTALVQHQFEVYYQPKFDLACGRVVGAEALVRWKRPGATLTGPAEFIALMEETGQIVALGQFVLEQACRDACAWQSCGMAVSVAVNVSARQFAEPDFVQCVAGVLAKCELAHELLQLEITEGVMMSDHLRSLSAMADLKRLGVLIAIDDFGTGYSSLTYLKRFPVDVIKIDRAFVSDMLTGDSDKAIIAAIVHMARSMHMGLVAEGVEELAQANALRALGCDIMQGYLYGRPMPLPQFERLLAAQAR